MNTDPRDLRRARDKIAQNADSPFRYGAPCPNAANNAKPGRTLVCLLVLCVLL